MSLGRHLRILVGVLVTIQILTSLAGIAVLGRMSPAIGGMLQDNVDSAEAVRSMTSALARAEGTAERRRRFVDALEAAERNVTEPEERVFLEAIRAQTEAALAGQPEARREVLDALVALDRVNREAIERASGEALRLGSAGRWALAILALLGLAASWLTSRRVRGTLIAPLAEIAAVLTAYETGDRHRRCAPIGPTELTPVLDTLDRVLDRADREPDLSQGRTTTAAKALVAQLLDEREPPVLVLDGTGRLFAANRAAMEQLASGAIPAPPVRPEELGPSVGEVRAVEGTGLSIVTLPPAQ